MPPPAATPSTPRRARQAPPAAGPQDAVTATRRVLLLGGLAAMASAMAAGEMIDERALPGRVRLRQILALNGPDGVIPDSVAGPVRSGSFVSTARGGRRTGWVIAFPPGAGAAVPATSPAAARPSGPTGAGARAGMGAGAGAGPEAGSGAGAGSGPGAGAGAGRLPVGIVLHGHGGDERSMLDLGLHRFLAAVVRSGTPPFALAAVAGGNGYWHRRGDGEDSGRMIVQEFLPLLAEQGLAAGPADRVGLLGWSMGGFGALLLAERLGAQRVAAVGTMSAALWRPDERPVAGAFDDASDLAANDVFAGRDRLAGIAVRIDCGLGDPFLPANQDFAAGLRPAPLGGFTRGGHTDGYWRRIVPRQLAMIGSALEPRANADTSGTAGPRVPTAPAQT